MFKPFSYKNFIRHVLIVSALASGGAGFAQAQDDASSKAPPAFHPASTWQVKALKDKASKLKICTLSAKFNNGFFIQMTAAQEGINSLSINFRQSIFARGTTANVGIAAPGVLKKILPALAFKPEFLAIDFEGQGALFDAIKTAGVMDFSMGAENRFRFYLNGLAASLPKFATCMKSHASPGAGVEIPVPVLNPPQDVSAAQPIPAPPPDAQLKPVSRPVPKAAIQKPVEIVAPKALPPQPLSAPTPEPVVQASPALEVISSSPPASVMQSASDERAPKGPPNPNRAAMAVTAPAEAVPEETTTLRSANIDQETGRAPPPPPRRLSEIEPPPVFTNAEPMIGAPSAEAIAKSKAAMEKYQKEMGLVMPDTPKKSSSALAEQIKKPSRAAALQVDTLPMPGDPPVAAPLPQQAAQGMTPESTDVQGVLKPGPRRPAIRGKRLTQMLAQDMQQQYEQMGDEGRLRPDIRQRLEEEQALGGGGSDTDNSMLSPDMLEQPAGQYELKPLVAPLVKKGSAEEKALADILAEPAPPANAPPAPVLPKSASGIQQPSPILSPDSQLAVPTRKQTTLQGSVPVPMPGELESGPRVTRQTKKIEVDLTDVNRPPPAPALPPRQGKSWLDILQEKQLQEETPFDDSVGDDGIRAEYVPDGAPAPTMGDETSVDAVDVKSVPALALSGGDSVLAKKLAILEQQLLILTRENVELEAELAHALDQGKQEKIAIESDNWNLEQSTNQYNEAKRQIDRLGAQIQKERAQCTAEKKELEAMLFDPQVTQQAQLARLAELEDALNDAARKLEDQRQIYEGRIKLLEAGIGTQ